MQQLLYINIHRHLPAMADEWAIQNLYKDFDATRLPVLFSAGLHPWYLTKENWRNQLEQVKKLCSDNRMLALGEAGLDKISETDYDCQKEVFIAQIILANQVKKPMIIHCVRAYEDVMQLLRKHQNKVPVIFHGFNKGLALAEQLVSEGYYLSFGKDLQRPHMHETFAATPLNNIFLETDDADIPIKSVYEIAADIRHISTEELSLQLKQNLHTVFNISV